VSPHWDIFVVDEDHGLVSYTGVVVRNAEYDRNPIRVGGIGAVKTHPNARSQGHAAVGLSRAQDFFRAQQPSIDFALLVCDVSLLDYYSRFGWREFQGDLMTLQHAKTERFDFNRVMVADVSAVAPTDGVIDLKGPPW